MVRPNAFSSYPQGATRVSGRATYLGVATLFAIFAEHRVRNYTKCSQFYIHLGSF